MVVQPAGLLTRCCTRLQTVWRSDFVSFVVSWSADANVWETFQAELEATLRAAARANLIRRHRLGTLALTTYAVTRALLRKPEHADLNPHVDALRRANRIGRPLKPAPNGSPEHPPATPSEAGTAIVK